MTENTKPEAKNKGSMKNVSKGPYRLVDGALSGKGGAPIAAFITGFTMSSAGVFGTDENNQTDNAKLGLDAFHTFRSTKRLPSQLAADLHAVEQEAERLRTVLDEIGGLCCHLRHGGPDPMDLDDLSNALATAVDMAHDAMQSTKEQS